MKKALSLLLALALAISCLSGVVFAADPLFEVTNGEDVKTVDTVAKMLAEVKADGCTKIKLLRDYHHNISTANAGDAINPAYSCELDLNGFTLSTDDGDAWAVQAAGSANAVAVVKNGTIWTTDPRLKGQSAVRVFGGALKVENVVAYAPNGMTVANYVTDPQYNADNLITGCILISGNWLAAKGQTAAEARGWAAFGYNKTGGKQNSIACKIENSSLLAVKPTGADALAYRTAGCSVELGYGVDIYTYHTRVANIGDTGLTVSGQALTKDESGTYRISVPAGIPARTKASPNKRVSTYEGLTRYSTPSAPISAEVDSVPVTSVADLLAAIKADGTSEVKLLSDIYSNSAINIPYSCTIDLNEHTVQVNTTNALDIKAAGSTEKTTTIKNGTVIGGMSALCWRAGALVLDGVEMVGKGSAAVQILNHAEADANAADYADVNVIKNSTLWSTAWYAISFNSSKKDFTASSIKIENSRLIAKTNNSVLGNQGGETKPGTYVLGENVYMYTTATQYALTSDPKPTITGKEVIQAPDTYTVSCAGMTWTGRNLFRTAEYVAPANKATLTVTASENGTITLPVTEAEYGTEVTATAAPAQSYVFSHLVVDGETVNSLTFTVPEKENVAVQGMFVKAVATVGDDSYGSVEKALEAAGKSASADNKVVTLSNAALGGTLIVPKNVTLDLNGQTLTVTSLDGTSGQIIDSTGGGLLKVTMGEYSPNAYFSDQNDQLPIWDASEDAQGYRLTAATTKDKAPVMTDESATFYFRFDLNNAELEKLLTKDNITAGIRFLDYEKKQVKIYTLGDEYLKNLADDTENKGAIRATLTGFTPDMYVQVYIEAADVEIIGKAHKLSTQPSAT